jgi:hypothetical protein
MHGKSGSTVKIISVKVKSLFLSHRFDIRHCTNMLFPAKDVNLYDKLHVVEVSIFKGSDKIICLGVAFPILCSDVQGHYFK